MREIIPVTGIDLDGHVGCGVGSSPDKLHFAAPGKVVETYAPCKPTPAHLNKAIQDLKAAVNEATAKVTIGLGISLLPVAKASLGPVSWRAEVVEKDNLTFSNGKLSVSNTMEGGASIGIGSKQVGLAGSRTTEAASYDMKSHSLAGSQPSETEWTLGGRSGGTLAEASRGSLKVGSEVGSGVLGGGSLSISSAGVQDLKNAWQEIRSIF